jgi:protein MpaA
VAGAGGVRARHHLRQIARSLSPPFALLVDIVYIGDIGDIGRSVLGRPIRACHLPGAGPAVLLFGAIHGDEPLGARVLERLAGELAPPLPRDTWIVPVANPDGLAAGQKNNARGVDLNRNFAAQSWQREHALGYDPGAAPGSEPETQALVGLIERIGARRLVALHSPFRTVNYDGPARALAERMAAANGYGASADIGYPTPGSFGSRYGRDLGCEVITLELPEVPFEQAWAENHAALVMCLQEV